MKRMARFQQTLASQASFAKYGRKSKRELFLDQMKQVVPWSELLALVEPFYPKAGNGRQPVGLGIMLRTYFLQQWFGLSDPGMEEAFYESAVLQRFAGVDLGVAAAPDETTILRFRHLLEQHELCGKILDTVNHYLESKGIRISTGAIVDATIIAAPSSTKNSEKKRDTKLSCTALCLRNFHLFHRRRKIRTRRHSVPQLVQIPRQVLLKHRDGFLVDPRSTPVGLDLLVCLPH